MIKYKGLERFHFAEVFPDSTNREEKLGEY